MRNATTNRMAQRRMLALSLALLTSSFVISTAYAEGDPSGMEEVTLKPAHDTWATHDDKTVHGTEPILKVGTVPQDCNPDDAKNYCTLKKPALVCCPAKGDEKAFCAEKDTCDTAVPEWTAFRKFRTYIRFNLNGVPKGAVVKAELRMRVGDVTEKQGGPAKVAVTRLKKIGVPNTLCQWAETELNDTNGTTWNSLPQNIFNTSGQVWIYDVTKAVADWLTGNVDKPDGTIDENCGFHLYDPDFGKKDAVIERWVAFSSKEGTHAPELVITIAKDQDKDGATADVDCDDNNDAIHPGAIETCDGIDNDCSGATDDEVCDGVDNDCDGDVDETSDGGVAPCSDGYVCANHICVKSCKNECAGPYDKKCEWDEVEKRWVIYGCGLADSDPCFDWFAATNCNPGQFCQYGSCSSNCIDLCDSAGAKQCDKDSLGRWHVSECGDWDSDSCLELKAIEDCKIAATCSDAACNEDGCVDTCADVGAMMCLAGGGAAGADQAKVCKDSNDDGCLDEVAVNDCATGCKEPTGCVLPGSDPPGEDAGSSDIGEDAAGDGGGDDVGDEPDATEDSGSDAVNANDAGDGSGEDDGAAADGGDEDDVAAIDTAVVDSSTAETGGADGGSCGACPPGTICEGTTCVATATPKKAEDDGCSASPAGHGAPVAWLLIVAAMAMLWARRRRRTVSGG